MRDFGKSFFEILDGSGGEIKLNDITGPPQCPVKLVIKPPRKTSKSIRCKSESITYYFASGITLHGSRCNVPRNFDWLCVLKTKSY